MSLLRRRIEQFVAVLFAEETYDEEEGVRRCADGSPCSVCVSSAQQIARKFDGELFGYARWFREFDGRALPLPKAFTPDPMLLHSHALAARRADRD